MYRQYATFMEESLLVNCARFSLALIKYTIKKHILIGNCNYVSNKR